MIPEIHAIRHRAWLRHLQFLLLGYTSDKVDNSSISHKLELLGIPSISRSTFSRWASSEASPKKSRIDEISKGLNCPKIGLWLVSDSSVLPLDNQLRLLSFMESWAAPNINEADLVEKIQWIWNRWCPSRRNDAYAPKSRYNKMWNINFIDNELIDSNTSEEYLVKYKLINYLNRATILDLMISLANAEWKSQASALESPPFDHQHSFTTWVVDTLGCCMLLARLYQDLGDSAYYSQDKTIDLVNAFSDFILKVDTFKHDENNTFEENRMRQTKNLFISCNADITNPVFFRKNLLSARNIIEKILKEYGISNSDAIQLQHRIIKNFPSPPTSA